MAITVYDAPDCWTCVEVREALDAAGVPYEALTVRGDPAAYIAAVHGAVGAACAEEAEGQ